MSKLSFVWGMLVTSSGQKNNYPLVPAFETTLKMKRLDFKGRD